MVREEIIKIIKEDFHFIEINEDIMALLLYGSQITKYATLKSDIDICIVTPNQDLHYMYKFVMHNLKNNVEKYDIRFFEELPLHLQGEIIENGVVIICKDEPALFEYFFKYRKLWNDQKYKLKYLIS